jgi:hypothetical protein
MLTGERVVVWVLLRVVINILGCFKERNGSSKEGVTLCVLSDESSHHLGISSEVLGISGESTGGARGGSGP